MSLSVEIRRNSDGFCTHTIMYEPFSYYYWADGNGSCDCNRELLFIRAVGLTPSYDPKCGDGAYSVRITDFDTGRLLFDEFNDPEDGWVDDND